MARQINGLDIHQKKFVDLFKRLTYSRHSWQAWGDFILMAACAISNRVDKKHFEKREQMYLETIKRYEPKDQEIFPKLFAAMVNALDNDPEQDFLGELFQQLELSSHWHGQFFTPYHLCLAIAEMQSGDLTELVRQKGFVSVSDPACGAGALLIAFANSARKRGVNYQNHVLFVAQDIDPTAAMMCYIQLSLIGCPGYVIVGDTLAQPGMHPDNDIWYTPMYFSDVWHKRRLYRSLDRLISSLPKAEKKELEVNRVLPKPIRVEKPKKEERPLQLTLF